MLHHPRRIGEDPRCLIARLVERADNGLVAPERLPQMPLHRAGESAPAGVGFDIGDIDAIFVKHLRCQRLCLLHRGFRIEHVEHIGFFRIYAVHDGAEVILACVRRVHIRLDRREKRMPAAVARYVVVGLERAVEPPFDVDRLLLIVRRRDVRAHRPHLVLVGLAREDRIAEHRPVVLQCPHRDVPDAPVFVLLKHLAGEVVRRPARHDNDNLTALLETREHRITEPVPMLFFDRLVICLLGVLDEVVDNHQRASEPRRGARRRGRKITVVPTREAPQIHRRVARLDRNAGEDVAVDDACCIRLDLLDAVAHVFRKDR